MFQKPKKPQRQKSKKIFFKFFILLIFVLGFYLVFFSNFFLIREIKNIDKELKNSALFEKIIDSVSSTYGKNLIFTNTQKLAEEIIVQFPELNEIHVIKSYPHTIKISFSEFPAVANLLNETANIKKSFVLNSIGFSIKEDSENPNLPYIKIKSDEPVNTKNAVIDKNRLKYMLDASAYFEEKFGMKIKEILYKPTAREIHLLTDRDFYIWLDIQKSYEDQLKKLKKALIKLDISNENLAYIDLRIAEVNGYKIIYKRK